MFKRVLATVLTILMLLSIIPATLASAATIPGTQIVPSYYLDDNNNVRWYYFDFYGWYFQYGYSYSDSMTDYAAVKPGASAPATGYMYVYGTATSYAACKYTAENGWEITAYAGGLPGQGGGLVAMNNYTLEDNNGAIWKNIGGSWVYVINAFLGLTGTLSDYYDNYKTYPQSGIVRDTNSQVYCYASFSTATNSWSLTYNGNFGQMTSGYTIFDGRATWSVMFSEWMFVATLSNGQRISGDVDDYYAQFGEYPTTGAATDAQGNFISYCQFDQATNSWRYSAGPNVGVNAFDYIIDNNGVRWVSNMAGWNYVKPDNSYGTVSQYYAAYQKYPVSGTAYNSLGAQVASCSFEFGTFTWKINTSGTVAAYAYIIDSYGRQWVNNNVWNYVKPDNTYGTVAEYVAAYVSLPENGTAYNAQGVPVASCTFDSITGAWTVGNLNNPSAGITGSYYLLDDKGVYWYYRNNTWCFQTNTSATGFGGAGEYYGVYGVLPMSGTLYSASGASMGLYLFNTTTYNWEPIGDSLIPDWSNPGVGGSGSVSDGYYSGQLADPNTAQKVYDTNNRLWTKSGTVWTSLYSSYYTVANPARYIDSTNRVWEMRNGRWVVNENATPNAGEGGNSSTSGAVNPNNLTTLTDTKGYVWNKSGSVWTSNASSYYSVLNISPEYKASNNSVWKLNTARTTWTNTAGGQTPAEPSTPTIPESVDGYTAYVFNGKTYQVPNHTIEIVPGPTTMPYKPEGYSWITYGGKYTLMNLNTGDIYPIPVLYQLPANYYYQPTYDKDNPWKIVGNGTFSNSSITSIELTDYPYKLEIGKTYQCKAEYESAYDQKGLSTILIWSSSDPDVATVDQTGKVTIVGEGRADIKVRAFLGFVETQIDIYGIAPEVKPEDKPDQPVTPPVVTTPVSDIFTDVSANAPYTEYIQYVYDNEIFKGMSETTFGPESTMTRAQFYTVLARMAGYTDAELKVKYPSTKFADSQDKWFTAAVEWAYTEGLDGGVGAMQIKDANGELVWVENCFNPDGAIKREDACAALYNFAKKYNKTAYAQLASQPYKISFADANAVNWWAQPAVSSFAQLGILSGHIIDSGNNFRPEDPATRSDIATIIARYAKLYMK